MAEPSGYARTRLQLAEVATKAQARYTLGQDVDDGIPYEQAIYELLHDRIIFPVPEDEPKIREMLTRPAAAIREHICGINERLFMLYDAMEREIDITVGLLGEMNAPDNATVINELLRQEEEFREFAEYRDNIIERLGQIARRRGLEYAMRQRVRDGVLRTEFATGKEYAERMMQGFVSAIGTAYIEPVRIVFLHKAQQSKRIPELSVQSVAIHMTEEDEDDRWLDANLAIRLSRMFVSYEQTRIWGDRVEARMD